MTSTDKLNQGSNQTCESPSCDPNSTNLEIERSSEELARFAWAISHPARVQILKVLLARHSCMCGEIVACLPLAQSTVSQHLKILKESGLVQGEVDGPKVCYCVDPSQLDKFKVLIRSLA